MRVISFIREKHSNHWYYFLSDLTSAHYADATQQFLKDEGISYIPKYNNLPAVASLRPIEDFWAALKNNQSPRGIKWSAVPWSCSIVFS